jgi:hypothetical protein
MGRCLAFNFSPEELKQKLKSVRYFVYTPDYDSPGYVSDQHFYAVLSDDLNVVKKALNGLPLQGSNLRLTEGKDGKLFVILESRDPKGAITDRQVADVLIADEALRLMNVIAAPFARNQDVVFGELHVHAKELSQPFKHKGAFHVPLQTHWFAGKNYEEARSKFEASQRK